MPDLSAHSPAAARKLLAFPSIARVASIPASPAPSEAPMEARLVRPALVTAVPGSAQLAPGAALAHDARNALTSLALLSGLLAEPGVLSQGNENYAADLGQVATKLAELVEGLAGCAQAAPQSKTLLPATKNAASAQQALADCERLLRLTAGPQVAVHVSSESGLPPLALDDASLHRVLVNLVKNAAEAMPEGGTVRITARRALSRTAPAVLIHVSDDGPGIPAHALEHIFKPGFSSKRGARGWNGARGWDVDCGLGLAIVRDLVEAAGGAVQVASTRKRGTTFELRLPCLRRDN